MVNFKKMIKLMEHAAPNVKVIDNLARDSSVAGETRRACPAQLISRIEICKLADLGCREDHITSVIR